MANIVDDALVEVTVVLVRMVLWLWPFQILVLILLVVVLLVALPIAVTVAFVAATTVIRAIFLVNYCWCCVVLLPVPPASFIEHSEQ